MAVDGPNVVVTRRLPGEVEARLAAAFPATLNSEDRKLSHDELLAAMRKADVLVPTITDRIDAGLLSAAGPRLKLIASFGAGVDHIDLEAAEGAGIAVTNTPGVLTEDTADMGLALILAAVRRVPEGLAEMQAGRWQGWAPTAFLGGRIRGRALGVLGMGRIGQALAHRARALGMEIHYHNRRRLPEAAEAPLSARYWDSLDRMMAHVDVLSVNCPHTPATYRLVNARRLKLMKASAVIVNTSRGEVIDEAALTRALRTGEIAGAGLDVFEHGHEINPRLRALENVVLLPHMGSATREGRIETGARVIANITAFAEGRPLPDLCRAADF